MARWRTRKSGIKRTFRKRKTFRKNKRFSKHVKSTYKRKKRTMNKLYGGMKHKKKIWKPPKSTRRQGFCNLFGRRKKKQLLGGVRISKGDPEYIETLPDKLEKIYKLVGEDDEGDRKIELLGKGASGKVYQAQTKEGAKEVAVKKIQSARSDSKNEITILERIKESSSQYVVNIIEKVDARDGHTYIVMENMSGGSLDKYRLMLTYEDVRVVVAKIAYALKFLHGKNIVHCDIKPENILVKDENDKTSVKLADFGFSQIKENGGVFTRLLGFSPYYAAPELVQPFLDDEVPFEFNEKVDCWALGVMTYFLLYRRFPFDPEDDDRYLIKKKMRGKFRYSEYVDVELKSKIDEIWMREEKNMEDLIEYLHNMKTNKLQMPVPYHLAKLETIVLGLKQEGSIGSRLEALEEAVLGKAETGGRRRRLKALDDALKEAPEEEYKKKFNEVYDKIHTLMNEKYKFTMWDHWVPPNFSKLWTKAKMPGTPTSAWNVILQVKLLAPPGQHEALYGIIRAGKFIFPEYKSVKEPPAEAKDLITKLLTVSASDRPDADQIVNHPWIKGVEDVAVEAIPGTPVTEKKVADASYKDPPSPLPTPGLLKVKWPPDT